MWPPSVAMGVVGPFASWAERGGLFLLLLSATAPAQHQAEEEEQGKQDEERGQVGQMTHVTGLQRPKRLPRKILRRGTGQITYEVLKAAGVVMETTLKLLPQRACTVPGVSNELQML